MCYKIGIDARSITKGRICGVSRVTIALIEGLSIIDSINEYTIYFNSFIPEIKVRSNFKLELTGCSRMNPLDDYRFFNILRRSNLDLFHSMHSWLPVFLPKKLKRIVLIHDLFSITDPSFFSKYNPFHRIVRKYFYFLTLNTINSADRILTVSNYSKKRIIEVFPNAIGKVDVIYNAIGLFESNSVSSCEQNFRKNKYILYIGNCRSYKNVEILIHGFKLYLEEYPELSIDLVIAGNDTCDDIKELSRLLGLENQVIFHRNPTDGEIIQLYKNALFFILPSKFEGFGIPVLEAMSLGTPVIISDAETLLEIAGDAALSFKKDHASDLADKIHQMVTDRDKRLLLKEKGLQRVKDFTWEKSAEKLKKIYEETILQ